MAKPLKLQAIPMFCLLDKTGTITLGNRMATEFIPAEGITREQLADAAQLASLADETPEGRSIVVLAKEQFNIREGNADPRFHFYSLYCSNQYEWYRFILGPRTLCGDTLDPLKTTIGGP